MLVQRKRKMLVNFLNLLVVIVLLVSLCKCEVRENNYNVVQTIMKSSRNEGLNTEYMKDSNRKESPTTKDVDESSRSGWGVDELRRIYDECQRRIEERFRKKSNLGLGDQLVLLYSCMKVNSFRRLDHFLSEDVIPMIGRFELIRNASENSTESDSGSTGRSFQRSYRSYASDILSKDWINLIRERLVKLLREYSMKINLTDQVEGRGRRRDHRMFTMMMIGFMIMASILVPMGFQFLTVLGGKSLLMAKMALIMSAINGLKKIATSNLGYGLYQAPEPYHTHGHHHHHHGFHDKVYHVKPPQEQESLPFNVVI